MAFLFFAAVIIVLMITAIWGSEVEKNRIVEMDGKKYKLERVLIDWEKEKEGSIKQSLGEISKEEHRRKFDRGDYSVMAWVEVGKPFQSWYDDPINRDVVLKYAKGVLPKYIQDEEKAEKEKIVAVEKERNRIKEEEEKKKENELNQFRNFILEAYNLLNNKYIGSNVLCKEITFNFGYGKDDFENKLKNSKPYRLNLYKGDKSVSIFGCQDKEEYLDFLKEIDIKIDKKQIN